MIKFFNKKTVIVILIAAVLFSMAPKPASANILDILRDTAVDILKQLYINVLVNQTAEWIQTGETPKFVTDPLGLLKEEGDKAGGKFIQELGLGQFCSYSAGKSFEGILKVGLIPIPKFSDRTSCTLTRVGENLEDFLKDFKKGGWANWQTMVLEPQNNIYGAYLMAWDQYEIEKAAALITKKSEVEAGKGYLDIKRCVPGYLDTTVESECYNRTFDAKQCKKDACTKWETVTPGTAVGDIVAKAITSKFDSLQNSKSLISFTIGTLVNALVNRLIKEGVGLLHTTPSYESEKPPSIQTQCASLMGTADYDYCLIALGGEGGRRGGPSVQTQCAQSSTPGTADYNSCIIEAQCTQFSTPGTANYNNCTEAMPKCFSYFGKRGLDDCMTAVQGGADIEKFREEYASTQCAQFSPVATAYNECLTAMQSDNPDIEKFKKDYASNQCAQFKGAETAFDVDAQKACLTEMQSGTTDVREFEKNYMLSLIDQTLDNQNQILKSKQAGLVFLKESIMPLQQFIDKKCDHYSLRKADLSRVKWNIMKTTSQIYIIQSFYIPALNDKKQEIEEITDISQIPALWAKLTANQKMETITSLSEASSAWPGTFDDYKDIAITDYPQNPFWVRVAAKVPTTLWVELTAEPAILQNYNVSAAKKEVDLRQEDLNTWFQQLGACNVGEW